MYGPEVHPFSLSVNVKPSSALPGQPITYYATYTSPNNIAPTLTQVWIDDVPHQMKSNGSTNYQQGVTYKYTTTALSVGDHYYSFHFDDGSGVAIYQGEPKPSITPIEVSGTSVSPTSGTTSTLFTFQATYANSAGTAPVDANVYVDNVAHRMTCVSGPGPCTYSTGALFQATMTLPQGKHSFYVVFADSNSTWADPFYPGKYAGPNVGANAQPVPPGTILYPPDEDDNPNIILPGDSA